MVFFLNRGRLSVWRENGVKLQFRFFWVLTRFSDFENAIFGISDIDLVCTKTNKADISRGLGNKKVPF